MTSQEDVELGGVLERVIRDNGNRHDLDDVLDELGIDRDEVSE